MPRYLFLKPSSLGDIVHALIVAQAIKTQQPNSHITWVVRQNFAPILESTAIVDEIITFNRKGSPLEFFRLLMKIRAQKYDAVLDMQGLLRTGIMNLFARAPLKLCRRDQHEGAQMFANKIVDFPTHGSRHAVDLLMEFLPPLGLKKEYSPLKLKPEALSAAPKLPDGTILIFPSSRGKWAQKEWPFMRELTAEILNEQKYSPTVCIGPASFGPIAWCSDEKLDVPAGALDFCQKVTLSQLLPFISQAALVIGNDAGPTHMAAALGVPTLGLYGPTKPQLAGPYPLSSSRNAFLYAESTNIADISVSKVLKAARNLLA